MDRLKLKISTKILDLVEGLPRFRKGTISRLQNIRENQRKWSLREIDNRKAPENTNIEFNQIVLSLTFEHEDFSSISTGLKRYFQKSEKIQKFIQGLKESEDRLHASSWSNLGYITKSQENYFPDVDESLPEGVNHVSLSFHRLLPSVACIVFEFNLASSVSERINMVQRQDYIGPIVFKKLWPFKRIAHGYSMGTAHNTAIEQICSEKDLIRSKLEKWMKNGFGWKPNTMDAISYIDVYKITGNTKNIEKRNDWLRSADGWLREYGISINSFDSLEGKDFIMSSPRNDGGKYRLSYVMAQFDSDEEFELAEFLECKVRPVVISSTIFSVINKYIDKVEILRGLGFKNLYKRKKLTLKNPSNIQELKRTLVILSRLEHELNQSGYLVAHSISDIGDLRESMRDKVVDLGKNTIVNSKFQLKQVRESAEIIDTGLTSYLSVQSIYVMYKLQRWMFILSVVVTIATIVGVLSGWENIKAILLG